MLHTFDDDKLVTLFLFSLLIV